MDSDRCVSNEYANAISDLLKSGKLTPREASKRLSMAVDRELKKPANKIRESFVQTCIDLMYALNAPREYVSQAQQSRKQLEVKIAERNRRKTLKSRLLAATVITAVLTIGAVIGDGLLRKKWIDGKSSDDMQQFEVIGNEVDPSLVEGGVALFSTEPREVNTKDISEVDDVLGYIPSLPTWYPEGWEIQTYYAASVPEFQWFYIELRNDENKDLLKYEFKRFITVEAAKEAYEQNERGVLATINGWDVYVSENTDKSIAVWWDTDTYYVLAGPVTKDALQEIIHSIRKGE